MLVHRIAPWLIHQHVLFLADRELMAMVCGDDKMLNASAGELSNGSGEIADDRVHDLPRKQAPIHLSKTINRLRSNDGQRRISELLL